MENRDFSQNFRIISILFNFFSKNADCATNILNFDFGQYILKSRYCSIFAKILNLVEILDKNLDSDNIFEKSSVYSKLSTNLDFEHHC